MRKNKYQLLENICKEVDGRTLYCIQAIKSFGSIMEGTMGGYVESEENLSQTGMAWVADTACVYDRARVSGNAIVDSSAKVCQNATVSGNTRVSDYALVTGCARIECRSHVYGHGWVGGHAQIDGDAHIRGYAAVSGNTHIGGDVDMRFDHIRARSNLTIKTDEQLKEYLLRRDEKIKRSKPAIDDKCLLGIAFMDLVHEGQVRKLIREGRQK